MSESVKKCPYCGEEILAVARKCKHCGKWLPQEEKNQCEGLQKNSNFNETSIKECPFCCQKVPLHAKKCPHCGEWIEKKENKAVGCFINFVFYGFVLIAVLICFICKGNESVSGLLILAILGVWIYFLPTQIANGNKHKHTLWIFIINLFLGWSVLAWIACLIWALSDNN